MLWAMPQPTYVNVECINSTDHSELLTIAVPVAIVGRLPIAQDQGGWFTFDNPQLVLQVPGSFIVRR